jgi:beta-1,2-mannobiose phosphorylase / 1,2-beta-oligomannan phosphorylase
MLNIIKEGIVLKKSGLGFDVEGVLNPAVIMDNETIHMFYRAVAKGNYSSIGYCTFKNPLKVEERMDTPMLFPQFDYEMHGVEDARVTKIDDLFYLTYTAYDGVNALGCLATSNNLIHWEKLGIIVPQMAYKEFNRLASTKDALNEKYLRYNGDGGILEKKGRKVFIWDKNVIFFPRKIKGKFFFLHRIKPDIQFVSINSLEELTVDFWQNYFLHFQDNILLSSKLEHEASYIGGGCPPIETEHGWLIIYHGVQDTVDGFVYSACAALLDIDNPLKEIARLPHPLFKPEEEWELRGEVNNVCFPTGAIVIDDKLYIYYGAADEQIACATMSLTELLNELILNIDENEK